MERGGSDVAASLLATELKDNLEVSNALRAGSTKVNVTKGSVEPPRGRRRATRTQVQSLLEDQRRFALHDGVTLPPIASHTGGVAAGDNRIGNGASSRLPDMFGQCAMPAAAFTKPTSLDGGLSTSTVTSAMWDAVSLCSASTSAAQRGAVGALHDGISGGMSVVAPRVRRSWQLFETTHRTSVSTISSRSPSSTWCIGQRWRRVDDVSQANALANAAWAEMTLRRAQEQPEASPNGGEQCNANRLYSSGLEMCCDSSYSTASLPAVLSAVSADVLLRREREENCREGRGHDGGGCFPSSSPFIPTSGDPILVQSPLAFFTFTQSEYDLIDTKPLPSTCFTYASSSYLVQLWERFGNPVVIVDRWRWSGGSRAGSRVQGEAWVPSVEEVCAEYHRVTAGVLQQRRQRLMDAFQSQELNPLGGSLPVASPAGRSSCGGGGKKKATIAHDDSGVAVCASTTAASRNVHPFVASFDRYALLQRAEIPEAAHDAGAVPAPLQQSSSIVTERDAGSSSSSSLQLLSQPPIPLSLQGSSAARAATGLDESEALASDFRPTPPPMEARGTALQRLTMYTTPNPWFAHDAEVRRRACLTRLLEQEQATNVPYQLAANRYLALASSAAVALQRAVFAFYGRDDEVHLDGAPKWREESGEADVTDGAATTEASVHLGGGFMSRLPCRPPRGAFTVQLQPLPSVDPAAWRAADATVRKAACEALGALGSVAAVDAVASLSQQASRSAAGMTGPHKRARSAGQAQVATDDKDRDRVAVVKSEPASVAANARSRLNDTNRAVDSEASAPSESASEFSDGEQGPEGSPAGEEVDEGVKERGAYGKRQRRPTRLSSPTSRSHGFAGAATDSAHTSQLPVDATYTAVQSYLNDVLPFRCARLRGVVQAGWLLPTPPALPHTLTNPLQEEEVCPVDTHVQRCTVARNSQMSTTASPAPLSNTEQTSATGNTVATVNAANCASLDPILTEDEYDQLRKVSAAAVCNRVVSHTDEAVLLSLPPTLPRLHREVEQELERYLYDDASALMEVNPIAQSLVGAIRVAYTQNTLLLRFATRLEHVLEGLKKVSEESGEGA